MLTVLNMIQRNSQRRKSNDESLKKHTYIKNNISNQSRKKHLRRKENQRRLLPLTAENGLSTNTYTKKSSYTMVVTHFLGEDNAKFAGDWILHINHLIGTLKEFQVTGEGLYGEWRSICLTEIHRRYPEYTIMTLEHAKWVEWTGENNKEEKTEECCAKRV